MEAAGAGAARAAPPAGPSLKELFMRASESLQDGGVGWPERPVSRVLSDCSVATISLGRASPRASSDLPGSLARRATSSPLFGLAPGGVYRAEGVAPSAGALLPHRFTLTADLAARGGLLSVALSLGSLPLGVTQHPALWSSDFPQAARAARGRLWHFGHTPPACYAAMIVRFRRSRINERDRIGLSARSRAA